MMHKIEEEGKADVFDPRRWGLPAQAVADLGDRLRRVWSRFRDCFRTRTRDSGEHAFVYLRGLLTLSEQRNYANIPSASSGTAPAGSTGLKTTVRACSSLCLIRPGISRPSSIRFRGR